MAHRRRQGVGSVRGYRAIEFENAPHHELYLCLLRAARAHYGLLDLPSGVLEYFCIGVGSAANRRAARLAQFQRAIGVTIDENSLDGDFLRSILCDDRLDTAENLAQ